jgi:predicted ATPase with chaperone activity
MFLAELALDGSLRPCRGALAYAIAVCDAGLKRMVAAADTRSARPDPTIIT